MGDKKDKNDAGIERDLQKILNGEHVPVNHIAVGLDKIGNFVPQTKKTVYYIAGAVVINEAGQVLMIQEAKKSCYGQWYLPCGRVEKEETLVDACKREVEEEAGLTFEPETLISVESGSGCWYRFFFTGRITGGKLKTLEDKDQESLQAEWIDPIHIKNKLIRIRARDIHPVIQRGYRYWETAASERYKPCLPLTHSHKHMINRTIIILKKTMIKKRRQSATSDDKLSPVSEDPDLPSPSVSLQSSEESSPVDTSEYYLLTNTENGLHVPCGVEWNRSPSASFTAFNILSEAIGNLKKLRPNICGLVNLEHNSGPNHKKDGCCFSVLFSACEPELPVLINSKYKWIKLTDDSVIKDIYSIEEQGKVVPFIDLQGQ